MKVELSHIAIANPKISEIMEKLKVLALEVEKVHDVPTEKVKAAMIPVRVSKQFRIEILEPTDPQSPISKFLEKRPDGGIHHICFEVQHLEQWVEVVEKAGMQILPPGIRKAARGRAVFIHPKNIGGVLVELEELE